MNNIEKFLFVYSLLITTLLFFAAILFAPKPSNFVLILFIAPVVYYLWLKMIADAKQKTNKTFGKRIIAIMVLILMTSTLISTAGIYLYSKNNSCETQNGSDLARPIITNDILSNNKVEQEIPKDIGTELKEIKEELVKLRAEQRGITNILGISTSPSELQEIISDLDKVDGVDLSTPSEAVLGSILVKDNYTRIDAHIEPVASSRIVGSINKGKTYSYSDRNGNWYLVKTDQGTVGWVFASFVEEFVP